MLSTEVAPTNGFVQDVHNEHLSWSLNVSRKKLQKSHSIQELLKNFKLV